MTKTHSRFPNISWPCPSMDASEDGSIWQRRVWVESGHQTRHRSRSHHEHCTLSSHRRKLIGSRSGLRSHIKKAWVPYQPWSSLQQEAQKSRNAPPENSPPSEAQSAYGIAELNTSPARLPALDDGLEWMSLNSATDDMNSTWRTTPFNDSSLYPANPRSTLLLIATTSPLILPIATRILSITRGTTGLIALLTLIPISTVHLLALPSTTQESASALVQAFSRSNAMKDRPRKESYRQRSKERETAAQALNFKYALGRI